uniref:Uncharacterized protein n=1 Tax=Xiphophorus couchianus TaxID=32473 RepID=A0A3B5M347_9TELE
MEKNPSVRPDIMSSMLEEDLLCPVCLDIYKDPVFLPCSHSLCKACLLNIRRERREPSCPVCRRRSAGGNPPCNLALRRLCNTFLQERSRRASEGFCSLHFESLKLFCLDHEQPVCLICRDSVKHAGHRFRPVSEARLQNRMQFRKFFRFLADEEEARLTAVRKEAELKIGKMVELMKTVKKNISGLSETIRTTEDELNAEDLSLLRNFKAATEKIQNQLRLDLPDFPSGVLLDEAKHCFLVICILLL